MKTTHATNRDSPNSKWMTIGRGWNRRYDATKGVITWGFWQPTHGGAAYKRVEVSEIYVSLSGRKYAADLLRQARAEMRAHIESNTCYRCVHRKMDGCTQGREAYPYGGPDACHPSKKRRGYERFVA